MATEWPTLDPPKDDCAIEPKELTPDQKRLLALCEQLGLAPLPIETDAGLQALADPILDEEMARIASAN